MIGTVAQTPSTSMESIRPVHIKCNTSPELWQHSLYKQTKIYPAILLGSLSNIQQLYKLDLSFHLTLCSYKLQQLVLHDIATSSNMN